MESHRQIEERAARLLAKRDGGAWTDSDQAQFESWVRADTAHRVAVLRLEAAWEEARRLKAIAAGLPPGMVPPPGEWRRNLFFNHRNATIGRLLSSVSLKRLRPVHGIHWRGRVLSVAAACLLAIFVGSYILTLHLLDGGRFRTSIGEITDVRLQDGSRMTLNTNSEAWVKFTPNERRVELVRGEAFFDDVRDPKRPFVVYVGDKRVEAIGTAFSVDVGSRDIRVIVIQGAVRLEERNNDLARPGDRQAHGGSAESAGSGATGVLLDADMIARAAGRDLLVQNISLVQAEQALSWRSGFLTFHDTTLGDAVLEFNRYNSHQMLVGDPAVAGIRISGTFRPTDYQAFVHLLQEAYSIQATSSGDATLLGR